MREVMLGEYATYAFELSRGHLLLILISNRLIHFFAQLDVNDLAYHFSQRSPCELSKSTYFCCLNSSVIIHLLYAKSYRRKWFLLYLGAGASLLSSIS
jgi:hypothetical protein